MGDLLLADLGELTSPGRRLARAAGLLRSILVITTPALTGRSRVLGDLWGWRFRACTPREAERGGLFEPWGDTLPGPSEGAGRDHVARLLAELERRRLLLAVAEDGQLDSVFGGVAAICCGAAARSRPACRSIAVMMSPGLSLPVAGVFVDRSARRARRSCPCSRSSRPLGQVAVATSLMPTPSQPRVTLPFFFERLVDELRLVGRDGEADALEPAGAARRWRC